MQMTLKALRTNKNLSQTEAAEKLNVCLATLCNYETGKRMPNALMIAKMCSLYGCKFEDINFCP